MTAESDAVQLQAVSRLHEPSMSENWTCPFCPLRCDDLLWPASGALPSADALDCPLAAAALARCGDGSGAAAEPTVDGRPADWTTAIAEAGRMLADATAVVIRGSMPDVATARAAIQLAQRYDAGVMHEETESHTVLRQAIARDGVITATFGELRQHADLVILVGDVWAAFPRLAGRFLHAADRGDGTPGGDGAAPTCVWLNTHVDGNDASLVSGDPRLTVSRPATADGDATPMWRIDLPTARLERWLALLRLRLRGSLPQPAAAASDPSLDRFARLLQDAVYAAVLVAPRGIDAGGGETVASALLGLVDDLNRDRRAVLVTPDPAATFRQVASWIAGFGSPHRWQDQVPQPVDARQLAAWAALPGAVTLQIVMPEAVDAASPPGAWIRIRRRAAASDDAASAVDLPIGVPGIDVAGITVRGDGSVTLPLHRVRALPRRSAAEVLGELAPINTSMTRQQVHPTGAGTRTV